MKEKLSNIGFNYTGLISFLVLILLSNTLAREVVTLTSDWKFAKGHQENATRINFDDSGWQDITIPHDWAITEPFIADGDGKTGKLPWKGEGWYRTLLDYPDLILNN